MDSELAKRLNALNKQNDELKSAEGMYLRLKGERDHLLALLTSQAQGKSHAEREVNALITTRWTDFMGILASLESDYQYAKRRFSILEKAYLAEHASFTADSKLIKRQGILT